MSSPVPTVSSLFPAFSSIRVKISLLLRALTCLDLSFEKEERQWSSFVFLHEAIYPV